MKDKLLCKEFAAADDEGFAEGGNGGEDFSVQAYFARADDEFGDVVGVETFGGRAMRVGERFLEDEGIGLGGAHFVGENLVVESL